MGRRRSIGTYEGGDVLCGVTDFYYSYYNPNVDREFPVWGNSWWTETESITGTIIDIFPVGEVCCIYSKLDMSVDDIMELVIHEVSEYGLGEVLGGVRGCWFGYEGIPHNIIQATMGVNVDIDALTDGNLEMKRDLEHRSLRGSVKSILGHRSRKYTFGGDK